MFREIYIDGKRGDDGNGGTSWDDAWETSAPLDDLELGKEERVYVRAQNLSHARLDLALEALAARQGHDEVKGHHVGLHEEHYYVDGVNGDDANDGADWRSAVRTPDGLHRLMTSEPDIPHRHVIANVRNIEGFIPVSRTHDEHKSVSLTINGHPRTTG